MGRLQKQLGRTQHELDEKDELVEIEAISEALEKEQKQQDVAQKTLGCPECKTGILTVITIGLAGKPMVLKKCSACPYKSKLKRVIDEND